MQISKEVVRKFITSPLIELFFYVVPSIKLASVVKRKVTVNITDSFDVRAKISGYVATMYVPGENTRRLKYLPAYTRLFTFNHLFVNTKFVIEVSAYRGRLVSERSKALKFRTGAPGTFN